jgi:hypothetical protein
MASAVPKKCSDSVTAINPLRENKTPTRQTSLWDGFASGPVVVIYRLQMELIRPRRARPKSGLLRLGWQLATAGAAEQGIRAMAVHTRLGSVGMITSFKQGRARFGDPAA